MQALNKKKGNAKGVFGPNDDHSSGFDHFEWGCNGSQSRDHPSDKNVFVNAKSKGLDWQSLACIKSINTSFNRHHRRVDALLFCDKTI